MTTDIQPDALHQQLGRGVTRRIMRGVLLLLPLMVTFWLIQFAVQTMDGLLQPIISAISGDEIPGLSFAIIIVALFLVGALSSNFLFRTPGMLLERGIKAVPGVGSIYNTWLVQLPLDEIQEIDWSSGQAKKLLPGSDRSAKAPTGFDTVVRIEYPRTGVWSVGFLMGIIADAGGVKCGVVYMPSTPMPQSGWLVQLPLDEIQEIDWSSGQAMQYIVSAGVSCPESMTMSALVLPS